jgi:hypothetical protein
MGVSSYFCRNAGWSCTAATKGQLGQHQTVGEDGQPLLDDPKFIIYEKVRSLLTQRRTLLTII